jgi:hypothetical protein
MRLVLSFLFTAFGLSAIYLFACGALIDLSWTDEGIVTAMEKSLRPFTHASLLSTLALTLGIALFASGSLTATRTDIWVATRRGDASGKLDAAFESRLLSYSRRIARGKLLEIAFAINSLVAGGVLLLLGMSAFQPSNDRVVGALFITAVLEAGLGIGLAVALFRRQKTLPSQSFRPLFAASAGLGVLELLFMMGILVCGSFGASS